MCRITDALFFMVGSFNNGLKFSVFVKSVFKDSTSLAFLNVDSYERLKHEKCLVDYAIAQHMDNI